MQKIDRDELVRLSAELFRAKGYHHTSMADIASAAGLLKGSLYHHFPSKQALAVAVMEKLAADSRETVFAIAYDEARPRAARLAEMGAALERGLADCQGGCLMGNFALETIDTEPGFTANLRAYFAAWTAALMQLAPPGTPTERARILAEDAIARIEGAVMLMRIYGDATPLRRATRTLPDMMDSSTSPMN